jgi:hypothetical protein
MALDEGKMGKKPPDPDAEFRRVAGARGSFFSLLGLREKTTDPVRLADAIGEVAQDRKPDLDARALVIVAPTNRASVLVDVVTNTSGMIAVICKGAVRPLRLQFSNRDSGSAGESRWVEVRVGANGLEIEGVPEAAVAVPWTSGPVDAKALAAALDKARASSSIAALAPVDVLASPDTTAQRLIDVVVALDAAGVRMIGLGSTPKPESVQAKVRGHRPPPRVVLGQPLASGDIFKKDIRETVKGKETELLACYQALAEPRPQGTVVTQFVISANGKVQQASAGGGDPKLATCVKSVIEKLTFPKPRSGIVQVNYPLTFRP